MLSRGAELSNSEGRTKGRAQFSGGLGACLIASGKPRNACGVGRFAQDAKDYGLKYEINPYGFYAGNHYSVTGNYGRATVLL